ncbi:MULTISPECIES: YolD-like family protein [unclassified Paenibacillus]|uniref:YolD-like family protein n=1 Tax=unclassified Paenibacillus TaxID=185978 RepID=UPI0030FBB985
MQRKKLEGNGLWESSRMIMPEHKIRILDDALNEETRKKPELDPQALTEISEVLAQSLEDCSPITLKLFGEYEDRSIHGIVMRVDRQLGQIKFRHDDDWEWIKIEDVVGANT